MDGRGVVNPEAVASILEAARKHGVSRLEVRPDGSMVAEFRPDDLHPTQAAARARVDALRGYQWRCGACDGEAAPGANMCPTHGGPPLAATPLTRLSEIPRTDPLFDGVEGV